MTGHSMGGALAHIAALDLHELFCRRVTRISLITFGSPRVGNAAFAALLEKHVKRSIRFVNKKDAVPGQPTNWIWFQHAGHEARLDTSGNCWFNPTFVETAFLDMQSSLEDHTMLSYETSVLALAQALKPAAAAAGGTSAGWFG